MKPLISIIVPCFNSTSTVEETLNSILNQNYENWEALIINDGSTDNLDQIIEKWLKVDKRFKYFKKENGGLGTARNFGIDKSKGLFILPLDSDNKIRENFLSKAINIMQLDSSIGVVYGNAVRFGEENNEWIVGEFNKHKILYDNYIDACAVIRKKVFDELGLYETNLPFQGHEDWDFWLKVIQSEFLFYYLNEITFEYRVSKNSMIHSFNDMMISDNHNYIHNKHYRLYADSFIEIYDLNNNLNQPLTVKQIISLIVIKFKKKYLILNKK